MYMFKYVMKRLGLMIFTFSIIFVMSFVLIKLLPIPVNIGAGQDPEIVYGILEGRGWITNVQKGTNNLYTYDRVPILIQLGTYVKRIFLEGDFGVVTTYGEYINQPVWKVFVEHLPPTILLNIYSSLIGVPIGLGLGIFAALRKNHWQDHVISTAVVLFISVPSYVYAFLVQYVLCYRTGLFPLTAASRQEVALLSLPMLRSMFPAILSLAFGTIAALTRFSRAELADAMTEDYMLLARTKGLTRGQMIRRHALRNAMVPIFPMILGEFVGILGGSLIIEGIFSIPGVGSLYTTAITVRDYNFFMALTFFYTLIGLLSSLMVDISYGITDPRIQMGER